ncbi:MAG TPA: hypothetical protein VFC46_00180 [Humisphaera sp.]|nr:hypothetical protein [Humisphaera sp.]
MDLGDYFTLAFSLSQKIETTYPPARNSGFSVFVFDRVAKRNDRHRVDLSVWGTEQVSLLLNVIGPNGSVSPDGCSVVSPPPNCEWRIDTHVADEIVQSRPFRFLD